MQRERELLIKQMSVLFDFFTLSLAFLWSHMLREYFPLFYKIDLIPSLHIFKNPDMVRSDYFAVYLFVTLLWLLILHINGSYRNILTKSNETIFLTILKSAFLTTISFSVMIFMLRMQFVSRLFFAMLIIMASVFLMIEKILFIYFFQHSSRKDENRKKILIAGTGNQALSLIHTIQKHPEWGYNIIKVIDFQETTQNFKPLVTDYSVINTQDEFRNLLHHLQIEEIIFSVPRGMLKFIEPYLHISELEGIDTAITIDLFDMKISKFHQTNLEDIPVLTIEKRFEKEIQILIKRISDVIISAIGLLLLSPLFLITSLLIKLTSPGPVFFNQKRVSLHGKLFTIYKFRSMTVEAEKELKKFKHLNEMQGPVFKIKNDPRITPIGRFIRRTSIDELPQLYNVLIGDMSLVGPRPPLPDEVNQYEPWERRRLSVRPGITCLWHVRHRGETDFVEWMNCDMEYIDQWSLAMDLFILLRTGFVVISGKGAY